MQLFTLDWRSRSGVQFSSCAVNKALVSSSPPTPSPTPSWVAVHAAVSLSHAHCRCLTTWHVTSLSPAAVVGNRRFSETQHNSYHQHHHHHGFLHIHAIFARFLVFFTNHLFDSGSLERLDLHFFSVSICVLCFFVWAASYDGLMPPLAACHCNNSYALSMLWIVGK